MKKVLLVGGGGKAPPKDSAVLPDAVKTATKTPQDLKNALKAMVEQAATRGYQVRVLQLEDVEKSIEWVEEVESVLAGDSWDLFIIGNGIRATPSLTLCFEKLVAAGRKAALHTPMAFNTHPMDVLETIERALGQS